MGLLQADGADRLGLAKVHDEALALAGPEGRGAPRGGGVAVDGAHRAFGGVEVDGVAVAGGGGPEITRGDGDRPCVISAPGEHVQPVVGGILVEQLLTRSLRVAAGVADRTPALTGTPVGVGDHEHGPLLQRGIELVGSTEEVGAEVDELVALEQPGLRQVDETVGVTGDDERDGPDVRGGDRHGVVHRERAHRWWVGEGGVAQEGELVLHRREQRWVVGLWIAEGRRRVETVGLSEELPEVPRSRGVEVLELEVVAGGDRAGAEQPGERCQRVGLERADLEPAVDGVEQGRRRRRSVRHQLAGEVRPLHQARGERVDGDPPPVVGEVDAGKLEDAGRVAFVVEVGGQVVPVGGELLGSVQVVGHHVAQPHRRDGRGGEHHDRRGTEPRRAGPIGRASRWRHRGRPRGGGR